MGTIKTAIDRSLSRSWYQRCLSMLVVIVLIWYVLNGLGLAMNSAVLSNNTDLVLKDMSAKKVMSVDKEGILTLEDNTTVDGSTIKEYVRTIPNSGSYYIEKDKMSAEITQTDTINLCVGYYVSGLVTFIILLLYFRIRESYAKIGKFERFVSSTYILIQVLTIIVNLLYSNLYVAYSSRSAIILFLVSCFISALEGACVIWSYTKKEKLEY